MFIEQYMKVQKNHRKRIKSEILHKALSASFFFLFFTSSLNADSASEPPGKI